MKKILLFISLLFFLVQFTYAQTNSNTCGTDKIHLNQLKNSSSYLQKYNAEQQAWVNYVNVKNKQRQNSKTFSPTTLTIMIHDASRQGDYISDTILISRQYN